MTSRSEASMVFLPLNFCRKSEVFPTAAMRSLRMAIAPSVMIWRSPLSVSSVPCSIRMSTSSIIAFSPATRDHTENEVGPGLGQGRVRLSSGTDREFSKAHHYPTALLNRRERRGNEYAAFHSHDDVGRVFEIVLPVWVGGKQRPPALALGQRFVSPQM